MVISLKDYKNKVKGCWLGKNIGGTLGMPFEGFRGCLDLDWYTQDMSKGAAANDDLDLQLVWLVAAEKYGKNLDAKILAEYWTSYIFPSWSEYGMAKANLTKGILPPLSGWYNNFHKDSCGAFIRSEIWACLAPGHPEIAIKYAYEDAIVDHVDEGVYAEIFCAAVQSAAFVESDAETLINIGLSYIPADSGVAKSVKLAIECYKNGLDWKAARKKVLQTFPGTFVFHGAIGGVFEEDIPMGEPGYDAPGNIGIIIIGWLYGEGDFGKSICIATGCGEDADCTAATLGAILGIVLGADKIPEKWIEPIGDEINTMCIDATGWDMWHPNTVTDLTRRICNLMPTFMGEHCEALDDSGVIIKVREPKDLYDGDTNLERFGHYVSFKDGLLKQPPFGIAVKSMPFDIVFRCVDGLNVVNEKEIKFEIDITNNSAKPQWLELNWILPEEWEVSTGRSFSVNMGAVRPAGAINPGGFPKVPVTVIPHNITQAEYTVVLEVSSLGRPNKQYVHIQLFNHPEIGSFVKFDA